MDLYNRYLMRSSGEKKHQAKCRADAVIFSVIDLFKRKGWTLEKLLPGSSEEEKNKFMEELEVEIVTAMSYHS